MFSSLGRARNCFASLDASQSSDASPPHEIHWSSCKRAPKPFKCLQSLLERASMASTGSIPKPMNLKLVQQAKKFIIFLVHGHTWMLHLKKKKFSHCHYHSKWWPALGPGEKRCPSKGLGFQVRHKVCLTSQSYNN